MKSLNSIIKIALFLFLTTITLLVWNDIKIVDKIKEEDKKLLQLKENQITLLQIRKDEKDFFATKDMKYHHNTMKLSDKLFKQLNSPLQGKLLIYKKYFFQIAKSFKKIGMNDELGLKKRFTQNLMMLENQVAYNNDLEFLTKFFILANYEQKFFLSYSEENIALHKTGFDELMQTDITDKTKTFLVRYNKSFLSIVEELRYIGFNKNLGLQKMMVEEIHDLESGLELHVTASQALIKNKIENLYFVRYTFLIVALLFFSFLLTIIIFPIQRSLKYFKSFFTTFKDSNERIIIGHLKYTELQEIGYTVNSMLESRQKVEKAKEEFIANMSHELRTPLNAIIGFSTLLQEEVPSHIKLIKPISSSAQHLLHLINDILDVSKIKDKNFTIHHNTFNMYSELDSLIQKFQFTCSKKKLTLNVNSNIKEEAIFYSDWLRLSQVIHNLLSNAIKFTPLNGTILLSIKFEDDILNVQVQDNGIGIAKNKIEKILKPFVQADSSTTKEYGGTGLGLSISKSLIELMGGSLHVESEVNKGSIFSFTIPLQEVYKSVSAEKEVISTQNSIKGHILMVDDDEINQSLLAMLLDKVDVTYDIANDGLEAVSMYKSSKYDLVLMDENMPNMNGLDAMQKIKQENENISPIIALTANVMKGDEKRLIDAGMDAFLAKPIDAVELYDTIRKYLNLN